MTIAEILKEYNMTTAGLSRRFGIPYRTVQNWKLGITQCPEYITAMIKELLEKDK